MVKKLKNPFLLTGYYSKTYFCDRKNELEILHQHFENERNVVLYAWRRMGKSALIRCFIEELESQQNAETIYVDLLGTRSMDDAILQIAKAVYQRFGKTQKGISPAIAKLFGAIGIDLSFDPHSGMPKLSVGLRNYSPAAENSLAELGAFLQSRKKTILIALDEFQQIRHYSKQDGEAVFRSWVQAFPTIRFIFSGSHRNMMQSMFSDKNRPFYQSAQLMLLNAIPLDAYTQFIQKHFTKNKQEIKTEQIEEFYTWCRAQTYCIQLVCNRLYGMGTNITDSMINKVYSEILQEEGAVFSNYTNLLTDTQWSVLQALAKEEPVKSPTANAFIQQYNLAAASSVSTALQKLMEYEIVIKEGEYYLVHDVLLARWLQSI